MENLGMQERIARAALGLVLFAMYFMGWLKGKATILVGVATLMVYTALTANCWLYEQVGYTSKKSSKSH